MSSCYSDDHFAKDHIPISGGGIWDLIILFPDHCLSILLFIKLQLKIWATPGTRSNQNFLVVEVM